MSTDILRPYLNSPQQQQQQQEGEQQPMPARPEPMDVSIDLDVPSGRHLHQQHQYGSVKLVAAATTSTYSSGAPVQPSVKRYTLRRGGPNSSNTSSNSASATPSPCPTPPTHYQQQQQHHQHQYGSYDLLIKQIKISFANERIFRKRISMAQKFSGSLYATAPYSHVVPDALTTALRKTPPSPIGNKTDGKINKKKN